MLDFILSRTLELRLMGTTRTIKSLDKEKRDREQEVKLLQLELDKKDRIIESLKSENLDPNLRQRRSSTNMNASSFLQQRKKERDLEGKIKELEGVIADERKHMNRLQQLNTQLLNKIKGISNSEKVIQSESDNYTQLVKTLKTENSNLKHDKRQMLEEYKDLKHKFDQLIDDNSQLAKKYDNLLRSSRQFEENALELYESHQLLTQKLAQHLMSK